MTLFGPEPEATEVGRELPVWAELTRGTRHRCDRCVELVYTGSDRLIGRAKWRRRYEGADRLLCAEHAHDRRQHDNNDRRL